MEHKKEYMKLSDKYVISAREFFKVLGLALYHVLGINAESSADIMKATETDEVWECACNILNTLYEDRGEEK